MAITAIYEKRTETYVKSLANKLTEAGYLTTAIDIADYSGDVEIRWLPTFFIEKHGKLSYALTGKRSYDEVLNWITTSGV